MSKRESLLSFDRHFLKRFPYFLRTHKFQKVNNNGSSINLLVSERRNLMLRDVIKLSDTKAQQFPSFHSSVYHTDDEYLIRHLQATSWFLLMYALSLSLPRGLCAVFSSTFRNEANKN